MRPELQILVGSVMLCACAVWHIFALSELIARLKAGYETGAAAPKSTFRMTTMVFLAILFTHTIQLYFWATALWMIGAVQMFSEAIYFSLVTYTTLGYGDIVLGNEYRIFGAMESITGVLMFGITTAFLVGYFGELMRNKQ